MPLSWRHWSERRRHRHGPYAQLFSPHDGDDWVALDLETTGLDPASDTILSIAAVPCRGGRVLLSEALDLLVRNDDARIGEAVRHHRLRPLDLAGGVPLEDALARLLAMLGSRPLVGYCIGFDVAMLDRALRPRYGFGLPNRRIDVQREYAARMRRRAPHTHPDLRLEAIASALGVPVMARHTALGDAVTAALVHMRLSDGRG